VDDAHTIWLYEIYQDEEAAQAHRASTHFQELALGTIVPLLAEREVIRVLPLA
jgi:quinol monooxygenase YgiN